MRLFALLGSGLATVFASTASSAPGGGIAPPVLQVASDEQLATAVARVLDSGGTIVLRPNHYRQLVVTARPSRPAPLHIIGSAGVRIERALLDGTARVSLRRVAIVPRTRDAWVEVRHSTGIELNDLLVTAEGTKYSASVVVPGSRRVAIRRSELTHCADRSRSRTNCLRFFDGSSAVVVEGNWFHDSYGSDFIHGRPGSELIVRGNRFERALPCVMGGVRCSHQDLVELFAGRRLRFVGNYFGVYKIGGAQLYLTDAIDHVTIVNNVFVGTDSRVPGYRSRVALIIGSKGSSELPLHVTIANNTILTGARRIDGYVGSLRMNSHYRFLPKHVRPVVANNVIALLERRFPVCKAAGVFVSNIVIRGRRCYPPDRIGNPYLDAHGRPTGRSTLLIDKATKRYAPVTDASGRPRGWKPDIGAYEYRSVDDRP